MQKERNICGFWSEVPSTEFYPNKTDVQERSLILGSLICQSSKLWLSNNWGLALTQVWEQAR